MMTKPKIDVYYGIAAIIAVDCRYKKTFPGASPRDSCQSVTKPGIFPSISNIIHQFSDQAQQNSHNWEIFEIKVTRPVHKSWLYGRDKRGASVLRDPLGGKESSLAYDEYALIIGLIECANTPYGF